MKSSDKLCKMTTQVKMIPRHSFAHLERSHPKQWRKWKQGCVLSSCFRSIIPTEEVSIHLRGTELQANPCKGEEFWLWCSCVNSVSSHLEDNTSSKLLICCTCNSTRDHSLLESRLHWSYCLLPPPLPISGALPNIQQSLNRYLTILKGLSNFVQMTDSDGARYTQNN